MTYEENNLYIEIAHVYEEGNFKAFGGCGVLLCVEIFVSKYTAINNYFRTNEEIAFYLGIETENYVEAVKANCMCAEINGKMYFPNREECFKAKEFIYSMLIMDKLTEEA